MDGHINTGANARRYLLRQPDIALQTKLRAMPGWDPGPEVLLAQRQLAPTDEEFQATRPSLRWLHLVSGGQAAAISHGRTQDVFDHAVEVMHV